MLGAACDASPLARPKSGIAPRLPHVLRSDAPLATDFRLPPPRFTTYQSLLSTHAILIAGVCPAFSPAAAPRISNRYNKLLVIELTRSQQTRKHFLIATICPTSMSAPLSTHHSSLITHHRLTSFLFDTNKPHKIIIFVSLPMKTKEKPFSIRYKFALRGTGLPAFIAQQSRITTPAISNRNTSQFRNSAIPGPQTRNDFLTATKSPTSQNSPASDIQRGSTVHAPDVSPIASYGSLITIHQSLITTPDSLLISTSALDSFDPALLSLGRTLIQERP